jgi:hypothetical protein
MSSGPKTVESTSTSAQNSTWQPNAAALPGYGFLAGNMQNLMQQPVPFFPGQTYIGPSALTQQSVAAGQQGVQQMQPMLGQATQNYGFLSNAADVANNPYVQAMMKQNQQSASDWLNNSAMPQLQSGAIGVNSLGSDRLGLAQGKAVGEAQKNLLAQNAQTQMAAYNSGLDAQQNALGATGAMLGNYMQPGQSLAGLGAGVEGYQQQALNDAMMRFAYQYQEPYTRMQNMGSILGMLQPLGTQYGTGAGVGQQPNAGYKSPLQTGLGLAGMAGGFMMGGPAGAMAGGQLGSMAGGMF